VLSAGVYAGFQLRRLGPDRFRSAYPTIGPRVIEPTGLHELAEGKVDVLIARGLDNHPGYRCGRLEGGSGVSGYVICPEGTASCPEIESLRAWLNDTEVVGIVARFPRVATGQVDRLGMYRQLDINLREPRSQLLYEIAMPLEPAHDLGLGPNRHRRILS